jgi:RNA polymerase sigma factor (sigma-70 family)
MIGTPVNPILRHVRTLAGPAAAPPDAELLRRYLAQRDEAAFAALVARHGPMVLSVCRSVLRHRQDAEDAFQAAFVVLARRGAAIRRGDSVASWLHGVARRLALKARAAAARRRAREAALPPPAPATPADDLTWGELRGLLHEELARLPGQFRAPLLLCYVEGLTRDEAARRLGWPATTVKGRLDRGRKLLHDRLARRGLTLAAALAAPALARDASAAVPAALAAAAVRAAAGGATPAAASLAGSLLRRSFFAKVRLVAAGVLLLGVVGAGASLLSAPELPPAPAEEKAAAGAKADPPADRFGDPLPPGALARMGTTRLRHGGAVHAVAFAPDGKAVASAGADGAVRVWDPATGKELVRFVGQVPAHSIAFSPDGKLIASTGQAPGAVAYPTKVHVWEAATGKEVRRFEGRGRFVTFSPDGKRLAVESWDDVILFDLGGKEAGRLKMPDKEGRAWSGSFSPDGKTFATQTDAGSLSVFDLATGKRLKRLTDDAGMNGLAVFTPDGKSLVSMGDNDVRVWDVEKGTERAQWSGGNYGMIHRLALAPDGLTVAWGGSWDEAAHLADAVTGKELRRFDAGGAAVAFSADGKRLAAASGNRVRVWDVATGRDLSPIDGPSGGVSRLAFSGDGKALLSRHGDGVRVWESGTGRRLTGPDAAKPWEVRLWESAAGRQLPRPSDDKALAGALAFSPDRKTLAAANYKMELCLWDTADGRELRRLSNYWNPTHLAFSPDGKLVAGADYFKKARLFEAATGREVGPLPNRGMDPPGPRQAGESYMGRVFPAFSPDGKVLAYASDPKTVSFWDVAARKEVWSLTDEKITSVGFTPDGRTVAVGDSGRRVRLCDAATGKELRQLKGVDGGLLAFAPDGRTLALADGSAVRLIELATGKERARFAGHQGGVAVLAFAADGRTLASGSGDSTAVVWDVTGRLGAKPCAADEADAVWADLGGADAAKAHRALARLAASPDVALPRLRDGLRPAPPTDRGRLARLLRDLDADDFGVREKAAGELAGFDEAAEPVLREALKGQPSAELKRAVEALLAAVREATPEQVRESRRLELLERLGTPEARELLRKLAKGNPDARLTKEAAAALKRCEDGAAAALAEKKGQ